MKQNEPSAQGLIFNIQRFSIQDGPGIRTTVFFKGCPLACPWCSNPESIKPYPEIMASSVKCIRSGNCVNVCPQGACRIVGDQRQIDFSRCDQCMLCVEGCSARAIERSGQLISVTEILDTVMRDEPFYRATGGGLNLSGGEPLMQWRFARELAKAAHIRGIHVALDTSGYAGWKALSAVLDHVDLVLFDLKHLDPKIHLQFTGVSNRAILKNFHALLQQTQAAVWARIPVIPGFNSSEQTISAIGAYLRGMTRKVEKVSLLPFHQFGAGKYASLGRSYLWAEKWPEPEEKMEDLRGRIAACGLPVEIGR